MTAQPPRGRARLVPMPVAAMAELPPKANGLLVFIGVLVLQHGNCFPLNRRAMPVECDRIWLRMAIQQLRACRLIERARPYQRGKPDRWRATWLPRNRSHHSPRSYLRTGQSERKL